MLTLARLHEVRVLDAPSRGTELPAEVALGKWLENPGLLGPVPGWGTLEFVETSHERTLGCSAGLLEIYGLTADEITGAPWSLTTLIEGADRQRVVTAIENALQAGRPFVVAYRVVRPDAGVRRVLVSGTVTQNDAGDRSVCAVMLDVTPEATKTDAAHEATGDLWSAVTEVSHETTGDRWSAVTEAAFDAVVLLRAVFDRTGTVADFEVVDMNTRGEALLGRSRSESVGTRLSKLLPAAAAWRVASGLRRVLEAEQSAEDTLADLGPAIGATSIRWRAARSGRDIVLTLRDASVERSLSEQIAHAQRMEAVGRLAGGIAHDFNNVLSAVMGFGSMARDAIPPSERAHADICEVLAAADRAAALTRQLLAFSRKQVLEPQSIDLSAVLTDLERMMCRLIGEDVRVTVNIGAHVDPVWVDAGQIEQVIVNLVVNARDAMPSGGALLIETRRSHLGPADLGDAPDVAPGDYVEVSVTDTGTGMPPEVLERLFEPFFTTKGPGQGTGLGLSTVYGIIKQSGGHIQVESEVGKGTTFRVYLPCATPVQRSSTRPPSGLHPQVLQGTETVLLVEDDKAVRQLVRRVLLSRGYTVLEAANAGEALLVAEDYADPIDLLLTDVVMPRVGGLQLARRLKKSRPGMAVLCMTGYSQVPLGEADLAELDAPVLRKPVTPDALLLRMREALVARRQAAPLAWTRPGGPESAQAPAVTHSDIRGVSFKYAPEVDEKTG